MLKSSLCDYSDAYILARGTITVVGAGVENAARATDRNNKQVLFKNCTPFTDCISEITHKWTTQKIWVLLCQCII